ncbi:oogenesis [Mactra antiquata]
MTSRSLNDLIYDTLASVPWQTKLQPTLPMEEVHVVLHEPAILGGYRVPHKPWKYYFFSLFQLHNETVNVWSHIIGCVVILYKLYHFFDEFDLGRDHVLTTLLLFGISCLIGLGTSAAVHLLHAKSPYIHFVAFMVDYIGATFCSFGSGIAALYGYSKAETYDSIKDFYAPLVFISSYLNFLNLCLAKIWYGHDPHNLNRKYMFIFGMGIQAFINMAPWIPRFVDCFHDNTCSFSSLNHISIIPFVFVLEAVAFAAHQPEKTFPGKCDIVGQGHQLFHVLIVLNHVFQLDAIYIDHKNNLTGHSEPDFWFYLIMMIVLYVIEAASLCIIARLVPASIKKAEEADEEKRK